MTSSSEHRLLVAGVHRSALETPQAFEADKFFGRRTLDPALQTTMRRLKSIETEGDVQDLAKYARA
jgi:hypothetical protein